MYRNLTLFAAIVLVLSCGAIHGVWTDRWQVAPDLHGAVSAMEQIPKEFGDWEGQLSDLDEDQLRTAGVTRGFSCRYINRRNGNVVSILLLCGRPGPVSVHPPEICYVGQGFALMHDPEKETVLTQDASGTDLSAEFSTAKFQKVTNPIPQTIRAFWSWSAAGAWQVPAAPRVTFARYPLLYKLYAVRELSIADEPAKDDPVVEFLREFLPELNRSLFTEEQ